MSTETLKMTAITRKEIKELGASSYLSIRVTKKLTSISKKRQANQYGVKEVLSIISNFIEDPKTLKRTRKNLIALEVELSIWSTLFGTTMTEEMQKSVRKSLETSITAKRKIQETQKSLKNVLKEHADPLLVATTLGQNNIVRKAS
jgi:hypothetical protein